MQPALQKDQRTTPRRRSSELLSALFPKRSLLFHLLLLILFLVVLYPSACFGLKTFIYRDFGYFGYPLAFHFKEVVWNGEFPLWNPYNNCGIPFLAQWNTLCLYPGSLLYLLLPLPWSLNLFGLLHLVWGGWGMSWLARKWTHHSVGASMAGVAFTINGLALSMLMWPNIMAAYSWIPWVIGLTDQACRRGGRVLVWAVLAGGVQMMTGSPEVILLTWVFIGAWTLQGWLPAPIRRLKRLLRLISLVLLVAMLAAAQLLPFLEFLTLTHRGATQTAEQWALPVSGLLNFLFPLSNAIYFTEGTILGSNTVAYQSFPLFDAMFGADGAPFLKTQQWIHSYYLPLGFWFLILALFFQRPRRAVIFLGGTAVVGILLAAGEKGGILPLLHHLLPALENLRFPVKFLTLTMFALSLLTGFAVTSWLQSRENSDLNAERSLWKNRFAWAGSIILLVMAATFPVDLSSNRLLLNSAIRIAFLFGAMLLVFLSFRGHRSSRKFAAGLLLITLFDAATHLPGLNPTVPVRAVNPGIPALNPKPSLGTGRAMISPQAYAKLRGRMLEDVEQNFLAKRQGLFDNVNLLERIPKPDGFYALYPLWEWEVRHYFLYGEEDLEYPALKDFLGVEWESARNTPLEWIRRSSFASLVTAGQLPVRVPSNKTLEAIGSPKWDPQKTVVLNEETVLEFAREYDPSKPVTISKVQQGQNSVSFQVSTQAPSMVVIAQTWHPSWRAYLDGKELPVLRANHAYQALEIPPGTHHVQLKYVDRSFQTGLFISLTTLLGIAVYGWKKSRPREGKSWWLCRGLATLNLGSSARYQG